MIQDKFNNILSEISLVLLKTDNDQVELLAQEIIAANKVVVVGAGRVGMAGRGFAMRLGHLGKTSFMISDSTVPAISDGDLLLACSGSGETQTIFDLVKIGKKNNAKIALITGNVESRMGLLADCIVTLKAPSKTKEVAGLKSIQPMTTLNEQCLSIFFDAVVLVLMNKMNETHDTMWARHSNLE